jgi:pyruvate formate lyase activating enzyme
MYTASKCIGAVKCIDNCPKDALIMTSEGIVTDYTICNLCGICAEVCPTKAFEILGSNITITELMKDIDNEAIFFDQSGGGVTFSGGEPLLHSEYLLEALKQCGKRMYHRVVDTTALAKQETLLEVADNCEMFLIDIKMMDSERHKFYTGVYNEKILLNIRALAKTNCDLVFRIPLMKNVNDDKENIIKTAEFVNSLELDTTEINLLPYHKVAENKMVKLGIAKDFIEFEEPEENRIREIISIFNKFGIFAKVGG